MIKREKNKNKVSYSIPKLNLKFIEYPNDVSEMYTKKVMIMLVYIQYPNCQIAYQKRSFSLFEILN